MSRKRPIRFAVLTLALATSLVMLAAGSTLAALVGGTLPSAGFTFTSITTNDVNMVGDGVHLKTKGPVSVKTTYSRVAPDPNFTAGWHYHNGPVIVTVTAGTLTFIGSSCATWDLTAGNTYIESTGEILNARVLPSKNAGISTVEWFSTRLYPDGTGDPVPVDPPCMP
jgi:hypothetical protein